MSPKAEKREIVYDIYCLIIWFFFFNFMQTQSNLKEFVTYMCRLLRTANALSQGHAALLTSATVYLCDIDLKKQTYTDNKYHHHTSFFPIIILVHYYSAFTDSLTCRFPLSCKAPSSALISTVCFCIYQAFHASSIVMFAMPLLQICTF